MSVLSAMRSMLGDAVPTVHINTESDSDIGHIGYVELLIESLKIDFGDFIETYKGAAYYDTYKLEDVIDKIMHTQIDIVAKYKGIDIVYLDKTIHMRFVIIGEDKVERNGETKFINHFHSHYICEPVDVEFASRCVGSKEEYRDYYLNIN